MTNIIDKYIERRESDIERDISFLLNEVIIPYTSSTGLNYVTKSWLIVECVKNRFLSEGRVLRLIDELIARGVLSMGVYTHEIPKPFGKPHCLTLDVLYLKVQEES